MMHRAVRSIIPQEVAMFDFLKQKDRTPPVLPEGTVRRHFSISGQVQGVGFRYRARYAAQALELTGWVENNWNGTVDLEAQGPTAQLDRLVPTITGTSHWIHIETFTCKSIPPDPAERSFRVRG